MMALNFSLNFVWIQAIKPPPPQSDRDIKNPIPTGFMDNIVTIARSYPSTPISIWADIYGIGEHPESIMQALNKSDLPHNVQFKPLDSIPKYRQDPLYRMPFDGFETAHKVIWRQVDLARLHVLEHCIVTDNETLAVYSDMDRQLTSPSIVTSVDNHSPLDQAVRILDKKGFFLGTGEGGIENQVIGVSALGSDFLNNHLIPKTKHYIDYGYNGWRGVFELVCEGQVKGLRTNGKDINTDDITCEILGIPDDEKIKVSYQGPRLY